MKCLVKNCTNSQKLNRNLMFHRFPKDAERERQWIVACGLENLLRDHGEAFFNKKRICSFHFAPSCYFGNKMLRPHAVPTLFEGRHHVENVAIPGPSHIETAKVYQQAEFPDIGVDISLQSISSLEAIAEQREPSEAEGLSKPVQCRVSPPPSDKEQLPSTKDIMTQTPQSASSQTPRKRKLRTALYSSQKKTRRLEKRLSSEVTRPVKFDAVSKDEFLFLAKRFLPEECLGFIEMQIGLKSHTRGNRYSPELKRFALILYFLSPKAYKYLKRTFCLPSLSVLHRQLGKYSIAPGINECIFHLLEYKFKNLDQLQRHCTLLLDEVSIKSNLFYNRKIDKIIGVEDLGENCRRMVPAKNALVLMIKSIAGGWKQPISYYFLGSSCPAAYLKTILFDTIIKLETVVIISTMMKYIKEYGGLVKVEIGPIERFLLIADYKMLEYILSGTKLLSKSDDYKFLRSWLGTGLLLGDGLKWKKHRKILTPAFHFQILEQFIEVFNSCGEILVQKLRQEAGKNTVDIVPFVTMCTLDVTCESTMGTNINAQNDPKSDYVHSVKEMCRIIIERSISPLQQYDWCYRLTKNYRIEKEAVRILHEKSNDVITRRSKELKNESKREDKSEEFPTKRRKAFLDLLLEATLDGKPLTHEEIREEVDTFMFAGHDTTATAISFTLFCLANHYDIQKRVYEEQEALFQDKNSSYVTSYTDLQNMKYLELVIKEALRLYPPVPLIGRVAIEDIEYENTCIPKGDTLLMFLYGIHRNPDYFEDPETFNPHRFENCESKFPYAYVPFSAGPRNCIGQKFAMLEMKSIISKIIRMFELQPSVPEHTLQLTAETVLKSKNGIKISLKLRC